MGDRMNENVYTCIREHATLAPDQTMFAVNEETISYGEFIRRVDRLARGLSAMGVVPGKKIALIIANSLEWTIIYWATVKLGAWPVPLDPQVGQWEMARLLTLTEAEICFIASHYRNNHILENMLQIRAEVPGLKRIVLIEGEPGDAAVETWEEVNQAGEAAKVDETIHTPGSSDPLMLACTSGSTGNPKIIVVPHRGFHKSQADMAHYLGFNASDRMLLGMPLYHQGGFGMGLQMILSGGTVCYQPVFEPEAFLRTIARRNITVVQLTATLAKILLSVPDFDTRDLSSVRMVYFAGEVLPQEVAQAFYEKKNIRVVNVIGSSETGTMVVWDSEYDREVTVNEFRPLEFTRMKVLDVAEREVPVYEVGTIYIQTDALLSAYYKNDSETILRLRELEGQRWFNTGDLGIRLAGGRVRFAGRAKRIIKRGSNLIYPEEIEAFLLTHPDIEAVAVCGAKHDLIGEMVVAHIQPRQGCQVTRGDLVKFCADKLSAYKIPDQVVMMGEIPHDIGKVQFKYLREEERANDTG